MHGNDEAIAIRGLARSFGSLRAVDSVELAVPRGSAFGLIGRNGAGKTTLLRILMALLRQDAGEARVLGRSLWTAPPSHRERVTYVSQELNLVPWMTLSEHARFASRLYSTWDAGYASRLAGEFRVPLATPVGSLSGGEKRKAAILLALAPRPDVLLLDEPAAGLDPVARREQIDALVELLADRPECTVLFSSHIISDVERIVDHVAVMDRGQIVLASAVDELKARTRKVQIVFEGNRVPAGFRIPGAMRFEVDGPIVSAVVFAESEELFSELEARGDARVHLFPLGLEEIFIEVAAARDAERPEEVMS